MPARTGAQTGSARADLAPPSGSSSGAVSDSLRALAITGIDEET
jgi:hypothetical protein